MKDAKIREKLLNLKELAAGSIFFPFTEPKVKSPYSGKNVGGKTSVKNQSERVISKILK